MSVMTRLIALVGMATAFLGGIARISYGYDVITHERLAARAVAVSGIDAVLKSELGLPLGLLTVFQQQLGQVSHLVQDASVPAHVRDDQHLIGVDQDPYEDWTEAAALESPQRTLARLLDLSPTRPAHAIFERSGQAAAPIPIAGLIDSNL